MDKGVWNSLWPIWNHLFKKFIRHLMIRFLKNFSREILKLYRCSKIIVITSVIELRVIQLKALIQAKAHITYFAAVHCFEVFSFPCFEHTHFLWGFVFSIWGDTFLRKYLPVSRGTVLSDAFRPGTLHFPGAHAYFANEPSTSWILYESRCIFLPVTCR